MNPKNACGLSHSRLGSVADDTVGVIAQEVLKSLHEYRKGRWRAPLFFELLVRDICLAEPRPRVLDIGCGHGFDGSPDLQRAIGEHADFFCGLEPDTTIHAPHYFDQVLPSNLENAPLGEADFDVAYAVFVLEHLEEPAQFWEKLAFTLKPGGVFWAFTVERRHYFAWASTVLKLTRLKEAYLRAVQGIHHYENYRTYYRCNTPHSLQKYARAFAEVRCWNWNRMGQLDAYVPRGMRPLSRGMDWIELALGLPGSLLVVRAVR